MAKYELKRIVLKGFKSFNRKTEIKVQPGITAIVGPNGCGKSNIADAVSWALGEQSLRTLRSNRMEELIFSGSSEYPALSMTEVNLYLKPTGNPSSPGFEPLQISRRLYRSGESGYYMNGKNCRLLDILNKLMGTGLWTKGYSVIEQGRIATIVNSRPEEIRLMLEEAAGISKYKVKRNKAQHRLKLAQENLIRLHDIIDEVRRQRNSLKRQASRARSYKNLREHFRQIEKKIYAINYHQLTNQKRELTTNFTNQKEICDKLRHHLSQEEGLSDALGIKIEQIERRLQELNQQLYDSNLLKERIENEISYSFQRAEDYAANLKENLDYIETSSKKLNAKTEECQRIENQLKQVNTEVEKISKYLAQKEEAVSTIEEELFNLKDELRKIDADFRAKNKRFTERKNKRSNLQEDFSKVAHQQNVWGKEIALLLDQSKSLEAQIKQCEKKYSLEKGILEEIEADVEGLIHQSTQVRDDISTLEKQCQKEREELRHSGHRLRFLNQLIASNFPHKNALRALSRNNTAKEDNGIKDILANYLDVDKRYKIAIENLMEDLLQAIVVDSYDTALKAITYLESQRVGYCTFIINDGHSPAGMVAAKENLSPMQEKGIIGKISDFVKINPNLEKNLGGFLAKSVLVETIDDGLRLRQQYPDYIMVTPKGEKLYPNGIVSGGWKNNHPGLLTLEAQKEETIHQIKEKNKQFKNLCIQLESTINSRQKIAAEAEAKNEEFKKKNAENTIQEQELLKIRTRLKSIKERADYIEKELEMLRKNKVQLSEDKKEAETAVTQAKEEMNTDEFQTNTLHNKIEQCEENLSKTNTTVREYKNNLTLLQERENSLNRELHRLKLDADSIQDQQILKKQQIEELRDKQKDKIEHAEKLKKEGHKCAEDIKNLESEIKHLQSSITSQKDEYKALGEKIKGLRSTIEDEQGKVNELKLSLTEVETSLNHLKQDCQRSLQQNIEQLLLEKEQEIQDLDLQSLETEKEDISEKLSRMGAVNLMAFDEFNSLEERFQFLTQQQQDIEDSINSLQRTIRRINQISRQKFRQAFEAINQYFAEIFSYFFEGGKAELGLIDEGDMLESGIVIKAKPPGKRLQNINLLSGGEKALTAIALLFAIFKYKPSPFCLLDEIDATLDESNIIKLMKMLEQLKQKTQFLLITHNYLTMEAADLIYGVTMEKPGVSKVVSVKFEEKQIQSVSLH